MKHLAVFAAAALGALAACSVILSACGEDEVDDGDGAVLVLSSAYDPHWGLNNLIVFTDEGARSGGVELYYCDEYGGRVTRVTDNHEIAENDPAWSYDGQYIAYAEWKPSEDRQTICTVPKTGGTPRRYASAEGTDPAWSPDGRTVAFLDKEYYVSTLRVEDGATKRLVAAGGSGGGPYWSPAGDRILFAARAEGEGGGYAIWYVTPDGSQTGELVKGLPLCGESACSPDGALVAVSVNEPWPSQIWTVNLNTGERRQITREPYQAGVYNLGAHSPGFNPEGDSLAFCSDRSGRRGIYKIGIK
jgi:Tol biopolymer transport system component